MNIDKGKVVRIAIIALFSLSIMIAGQLIYTRYSVEKSLINTLTQRPDIVKAELIKAPDKLWVFVELKNVDSILDAWNEINSISKRHLRGQMFSITILGNPNSLVEELYNNQIQYDLYEAIQTGNYSNMRESLDDTEAAEGVTIKVFIDTERLYMHLQHGEHYLYKILERA